jgi:hypothetical protein
MAGIRTPKALPMIIAMGDFFGEKAKVIGKENERKGSVISCSEKAMEGPHRRTNDWYPAICTIGEVKRCPFVSRARDRVRRAENHEPFATTGNQCHTR